MTLWDRRSLGISALVAGTTKVLEFCHIEFPMMEIHDPRFYLPVHIPISSADTVYMHIKLLIIHMGMVASLLTWWGRSWDESPDLFSWVGRVKWVHIRYWYGLLQYGQHHQSLPFFGGAYRYWWGCFEWNLLSTHSSSIWRVGTAREVEYVGNPKLCGIFIYPVDCPYSPQASVCHGLL